MSTDLRRDTDGAAPWMHQAPDGPDAGNVATSPDDASLPFDDPHDVVDLRERLFAQDATRRLAEHSPSRTSTGRSRPLHRRALRRLRSAF